LVALQDCVAGREGVGGRAVGNGAISGGTVGNGAISGGTVGNGASVVYVAVGSCLGWTVGESHLKISAAVM